MLGPIKKYRKKPVNVGIAEVLGNQYPCRNPGVIQQIAMPGEYVVNPGSEDEYPITPARLAELYEEVRP